MSKKLICLAAVCVALTLAGSAGAQVGKGKVLFEYWDNLSGTSVDSNLRTNANFPNKPTSSEWRDSFQSKSGRADNYGLRARAYLTPPQTGDYTFWVAGDDNCQLWLSTDDTAANAKMIAQVASWTGVAEWGKEAGQKSAPVTLQAGKEYYLEGLMKEGGGGDSLDVGWAGPGIGDATTVIAGQFCRAFIRDPEPLFKASNPDPANGKGEITSPLFQWTAGATAVMHEVYVSTNPTLGPADFMGPWPTNMYFHVFGLTPGVTYYWRVDEVDASGVKYTGDVWSFTAQPMEAHFPNPVDGALWRKTNITVSWTAGQGAVSHKVYGGEDKAAVAAGDAGALLATVAEAKLDASALLQPNKTYYWRVDEVDSTGKVSPGPVWTFTTIDAAGGAVAEYFNGMNLAGFNLARAGKPVVVTTVPEINFSWPSGSVKGTNSPDPLVNTDNFGARFTAQLNVPVSGKYRLIESTDDGGLIFLNGVQVAGAWANAGEAEFASAELDLVAGERYIVVLEYYEAGGGAAARLRWSGPGIARQIIPQGALQIPQCAISPNPSNGAVEVADSAVLSFTPGPKAVVHTMYFGTDKDKVAAGDASVALPPTIDTTYAPALTWNTTYYWKVDEMAADGTTIPGQVWSFTIADFIPVNLGQVTLTVNNITDPFVSQLTFDVPADLTKNGVTDLALRFQGAQAVAQGTFAFDAATGTYSVGGAGTDIWGSSDQFTYAYKTLKGDGAIIARVASNGTGANRWAKGGVMIRETLANNSKHLIMAMTGGDGSGIAFQGRPTTGGNSSGMFGDITAAPPYWVKLERKGDTFTAYCSADGVDWKLFPDATPDNAGGPISNPMQLTMAETVHIGLFVTSHVDAATVRTMTMDNVSTTGGVTPDGPFTNWAVINTTRNASLPLFVAIEDKAGQIAMVTHADPAAVNRTVMDLWRVPMSAFTGVDLKNAAKLYLGVGDGKSAGFGLVNFADVRIIKPVPLPDPAAVDITMKGDVVKGFPDYSGAWPAAEHPALAIDDSITTKYLNFGGKTQPPSGFVVTPSIGYSIVTGLTFTSANDAAERDPVAWELYGARDSNDGPWALIAKGAIDDFARSIDWPRRWKNVTPIGFANTRPYAHYKVAFTGLKRFASANSMQVAEVELLGVPAAAPGPMVVWVSFHGAADDAPSTATKSLGFTEAPDKGYTDLLKTAGYDVVRYLQTGTPDVAMLNAADLVIISRSVNSGSFSSAAATRWNGVTAPMIILNGYTARKNRMGFNTGNTIPDTTGDIKLMIKDASHPIFAGVPLTDCTMTNSYAGVAVYPTDGTTKARGLSIVTEPVGAGATVLATVSATSATTGPAGATMIAEWPAGATLTHDGGAGTDVLSGHRLLFLTGAREASGISSETAGMYDLYEDGAKMFLNAVAYMLQ